MRRDGASYLLIDHTESPGLTEDQCAKAGIPEHAFEIFGKGVKSEFATKLCSHCQRTIVLRPERIRARHVCPKCDSYICDDCHASYAVSLECVPYKKRIEDYLTRTITAQITAKL